MALLVALSTTNHVSSQRKNTTMNSAQAMLEHGVTGFMFTVPTLAREYVAELKQRSTPTYSLMRAWGVGGESVPADVVRLQHGVARRNVQA